MDTDQGLADAMRRPTPFPHRCSSVFIGGSRIPTPPGLRTDGIAMGIRILIVEDEAELADFIVRGLREEGFAVEHAADGEPAWDGDAIRRLGPDRARLVAAGRGRPDVLRRFRADGRDRSGAVPDGEGCRRRPGPRARRRGGRLPLQAVRLRRAARPRPGPGPPPRAVRRADARPRRRERRPCHPAGPACGTAARPDGQGAGAARPSSCGTRARCCRGRGSTTTSGTRTSTGSPTRWKST